MRTIRGTPVWVWLLLVAAVFGVSSAGALFQQVDEVPPLLRASWRLQLTSLILAPMAVVQWIVHRDEISDRLMERNTIFWIFAGGIFLALHFGCLLYTSDAADD